jgi:hypothetical protein
MLLQTSQLERNMLYIRSLAGIIDTSAREVAVRKLEVVEGETRKVIMMEARR